MNKQELINTLSQKTDITIEQSTRVVNNIEEYNIFAKSDRPQIISCIAGTLDCTEYRAEEIFTRFMQIINGEAKSKTVKFIAGTAVIVIAGVIVFRLVRGGKGS